MRIKALRQLFGYAHILLGLAVAGQFVASPTYDVTTSSDVWDVMSVAMAVGAATALVVSLLRIREVGKLPDWRATVMLIAAACLFLLFYRLWLAWEVYDSSETPPWEIRLLLWYFIDVLFVLVSITVGRYLVRTANSQAGG
jgi:cation transport ATPase